MDKKIIALILVGLLAIGLLAIVAVVVVVGGFSSLFFWGVSSPAPVKTCSFTSSDLLCDYYKLDTSGNLRISVQNMAPNTIRVTNVLCTVDPSDLNSDGTPRWEGSHDLDLTAENSEIEISAGASDVALQTTNKFARCYENNGQIASGSIGTQYSGKIYVRYITPSSGLSHVATGNLITKIEG